MATIDEKYERAVSAALDFIIHYANPEVPASQPNSTRLNAFVAFVNKWKESASAETTGDQAIQVNADG